jgi:predicted PurR-regulated permease PerM
MDSQDQRFIIRFLSIGGIGLLGLIAYWTKDILVPLVFALALIGLAHPLLASIERKVPRTLSSLVFLGATLLLLGLLFFSVVPMLADELRRFSEFLVHQQATIRSIGAQAYIAGIPGYSIVERLGFHIQPSSIQALVQYVWEKLPGLLSGWGDSLLQAFLWVFGAVNAILLFAVFFLFGSIERREIWNFLMNHLPKTASARIQSRLPEIQKTLFVWWKGQLLLSLSVGGAVLVGLAFLKYVLWVEVQHIVTLAIIAGICESIPVIGPLFAMIPAILVVASSGWMDVALVVVMYVAVQQLEGLVLVPRIQWDALRLGTFETILAMSFGGSLFWIAGIIASLPVLAVAKILFASKLKR